MGLEAVILAVIIGTLATIVYSIKVLVLMERRIARIDVHIEALVTRVFEKELEIQKEEHHIEQEEARIEKMLLGKVPKPPKKRKAAKKKAKKRKK